MTKEDILDLMNREIITEVIDPEKLVGKSIDDLKNMKLITIVGEVGAIETVELEDENENDTPVEDENDAPVVDDTPVEDENDAPVVDDTPIEDEDDAPVEDEAPAEGEDDALVEDEDEAEE